MPSAFDGFSFLVDVSSQIFEGETTGFSYQATGGDVLASGLGFRVC